MASKHERIARFLAQGLKPSQVASIVGCTPALLSQLAKDPGFQDQLTLAKAQVMETLGDAEEEEHLNNKYLAAEHKILDAISGTVEMMEPRDQIRALDVVASRQAKRAEQQARLRAPAQSVTANIISLTLPAHSVPEYRVNEQNEIVSIGPQMMAPMTAAGVRSLFTQITEQKAAQVATQDLTEF